MVTSVQRAVSCTTIHPTSRLNRRSHSGQDPIVRRRAGLPHSPRMRSMCEHRSDCHRAHDPTIKNRDELDTTMWIEVDTQLLTGELDRDIAILKIVV